MKINTIGYDTNYYDESHRIILNINMEDLMNIACVIEKAFETNLNWDCEMTSLINLYKKLESNFKGSKY